jgi:hypothetical protein
MKTEYLADGELCHFIVYNKNSENKKNPNG